MKMKDRITPYQLELMLLVRDGSPDEEGPLDFDQMLSRLSWAPTKAAAHFSVRALIKRELLYKNEAKQLRRGRMRVCFELTKLGYQVLDPRENPPSENGTLKLRPDTSSKNGTLKLKTEDHFRSGVVQEELTFVSDLEDPFRVSFSDEKPLVPGISLSL